MIVYVDGEDEVTKLIAKRLVRFCVQDKIEELNFVSITGRSRGSGALSKVENMVRLGNISPVVFIFDSDGDCVVDLLRTNAPNGWKSKYSAINIAVDEGESWLLADREGFSRFFGIDIKEIPKKKETDNEICTPYKTSLYIMRELVPKSDNKKVKENLQCRSNMKKPPTYNNLWPEYINEVWNIDRAKENSDSLFRAVERIKNIFK